MRCKYKTRSFILVDVPVELLWYWGVPGLVQCDILLWIWCSWLLLLVWYCWMRTWSAQPHPIWGNIDIILIILKHVSFQAAMKIHTEGCLDIFSVKIKSNIGAVGGLGIGIGFFQLCGMIFALYLANTIKKEYETVWGMLNWDFQIWFQIIG